MDEGEQFEAIEFGKVITLPNRCSIEDGDERDWPGIEFRTSLYKVRLWSVSIHMGKIFGMPTKILALVASLGLLGLSLTGVWMWWKRRPGGRSGFPRRPPPRSVPRWGWGVVAAAGILLPVAGASMILIGLLDLATSPLRRRLGW